jgi:mono/diheme cytochrome c family protein
MVAVVAVSAALGAGIWFSSAPARALAPSPEAGAEIAARWCAACHVVAPDGAGTDSAPSFAVIAQRHGIEELKTFLAKPHAKPMRGFTLSGREIADVVAYIVTLEQKADSRSN